MAEETRKIKKKYLEPTIHFTRSRIVLPGDETETKVQVVQLVEEGQRLLDFPDFEKFKERGFEKSPVHAGSNTRFSEDKSELVAKVTGYPRIDLLKQEDDEKMMIVSVSPLVEVSYDKMMATLVIQPPAPDAPSLLHRKVDEILAQEGVVFGLDKENVKKCQDFIDNGCCDYATFNIAKGEEPGEGTDAWIDFHVTIGPIAGQILEDGSIDFRERRIMVPVHAGQILATKVAAQQGKPGMNVMGEEVEAKGGNDVKVQIADDVDFQKDTGKIVATKSGILSVVKGSEIRVCASQVIEGDVDFETGNIDSLNCVTIKGDVQPGFKVNTGGDLEICGSVTSSKVSSLSNIVVKGGVTGKKSVVRAAGDVDMKFIERGFLQAGGNVIVRKQVYYSQVVSGEDVRFQGGAVLIGESVVAGGSVSLGEVGTENSEPALIAAAVDYERYLLHQDLKKQLVAKQDEIVKWLQLYPGSSKSKKIRGMEKEVAEIKLQMMQLNLLPGTGKYSRGGASEGRVAGASNEDYQDKPSVELDKISIDISGTIHAGTELMIGNRKLKIEKTLSRRSFKLATNMRRIIAAPYSKPKKRRRIA